MSLPPAKKQIKEHPAKDAVSVPVNTTLKNQDVHRKVGGMCLGFIVLVILPSPPRFASLEP